MTTVKVTATSLNVHSQGSGSAPVIGSAAHNERLSVLGDSTALWLHVTTPDRATALTGWVSAAYTQPADDLPPADDAAHKVTVSGQNAIGPDGKVFARQFRLGFYTYGATSLTAWLDGGASAGGLSASMLRTLRAVSQNEGKLEAVNSWDNSFMSFGMVQWTMGSGGDAGELPALLARLKGDASSTFQDLFGRYGLDVAAATTAVTGYVSLNGKALDTAAAKAPLRGVEWAYRFWRSGFSSDMRAAELKHAGSRFARFTAVPALGHTVAQWMSSEHAMALMLDEHVNRPGNVPKTLVTALTALYPKGAPDPATLSDKDEATLIARYLAARAKTTMTDSDSRARAIAASCQRGELSEARGSFRP